MEAKSGRDFFDGLYQNDIEAESRWLEYGALEKTNSVSLFLRDFQIKPSTLIELGCGTGAVIRECQRRTLAHRYIAVDYSAAALEFCRQQSSRIELLQGDIVANPPALQGDVVLLSHTLEHLEQPQTCLKNIRERIDFDWLIAEVPLEDLALGHLKATLGLRRDRAGHVQFFHPASFRELIQESGYRIVSERNYLPLISAEALEFVMRKDGLAAHQRALKRFTQRWLPSAMPSFWSRFYIANLAVLAVKDDQ